MVNPPHGSSGGLGWWCRTSTIISSQVIKVPVVVWTFLTVKWVSWSITVCDNTCPMIPHVFSIAGDKVLGSDVDVPLDGLLDVGDLTVSC